MDKNLNRLLYDQTKHECRKLFCGRCFHGFTRADLLDNHIFDCRGINQAAVAIEMPEPGEKIMFNNYGKQLKAPCIIYSDFESIIHKIQGPSREKWNSKHSSSWGVWVHFNFRKRRTWTPPWTLLRKISGLCTTSKRISPPIYRRRTPSCRKK